MATQAATTPAAATAGRTKTRKAPSGRPKTPWWMWIGVVAILVALIFRTLDALRIFDLPFVLTQGQFGTSTLSTIAQETFATNRIYGLGSAMAILTFIVVMIVSFSYIRFVGGNLRGLAEE